MRRRPLWGNKVKGEFGYSEEESPDFGYIWVTERVTQKENETNIFRSLFIDSLVLAPINNRTYVFVVKGITVCK